MCKLAKGFGSPIVADRILYFSIFIMSCWTGKFLICFMNQMNYITYYFLVFLWSACILVSFAGWGSLLSKILFPNKDIDFGQRVAWGVTLTIVVGGVLNALMAVSRVTVVLWVALGLLSFFLFGLLGIKDLLIRAPRRILFLWKSDKLLLFGFFVVLSLLLFNFTVNIHVNYQPDDKQGYAIFPQKMLQIGGIGYEPFSERRTHALGGQSFLQTLPLSFLDINSLHVMDPGLANIIVVVLLWGLAGSLQVSRKGVLLVSAIFLSLPPPIMNSSSLVMGLALSLALFRTFQLQERDGTNIFPVAIIVALLTAAICASKSNFIVFSVAYVFIIYSLQLFFLPSKKAILLEFLVTFVLIGLFLLPWMISSYQSCGTMLYPLLGRGYHYSAYGIFENQPVTGAAVLLALFNVLYNPFLIFLIMFLILGIIQYAQKNILWAVAIFASAFVGMLTTATLIYNGRYDFVQNGIYTWSIFYASLIMLMIHSLRKDDGVKNHLVKLLPYVLIIIFIPWMFSIGSLSSLRDFWNRKHHQYAVIVDVKLFDPVGKRLIIQQTNKVLNLQWSVPPGEKIIVYMEDAYLLDFQRNEILITGNLIFGPKPGLPVFEGGEAVAKYLIRNGIKYLIEDYKLERLEDKRLLRWVSGADAYVAQQSKIRRAFNQDLEDLGKSRKVLCDDGEAFVLDLSQRSKGYQEK